MCLLRTLYWLLLFLAIADSAPSLPRFAPGAQLFAGPFVSGSLLFFVWLLLVKPHRIMVSFIVFVLQLFL